MAGQAYLFPISSKSNGNIQPLLVISAVLAAMMVFNSHLAAEIPVFVEDDFSHDLGGFLDGTTTSDGNAVWTSSTNMLISFDEKAQHSDVANSGYVPFQAPSDSTFSIEAVASNRDHCFDDDMFGCNYNIGLGFSDDVPGTHPGGNIFGLSSLTLAINHQGSIGLWDNRFHQNLKSGKFLADVGLTDDFEDEIPMLLELDPVNNTARAVVNNVEVYNVNYEITDQINWGGFGWSSTNSGAWDDFKIRAQGPVDQTIFEWSVDLSGAWNSTSAGNWQLAAVPNSDEVTVIFGDKTTATRLILTDEDVTVKAIQFNSENKYVVAGAGKINLDSIDGLGQITVAGGPLSGDHHFQAAVKLHDETTALVNFESSLTFDNELDLNGHTLTTSGGGTVIFNNQITGQGTVNCQGPCIGTSTIQGNLQNSGILAVSGLSISGSDGQAADVSVVPEPATFTLLVFGLMMAFCKLGRHGGKPSGLIMAIPLIMVAALVNTGLAQTNIVIADNFNRPNQLLHEGLTPIGNVEWDATYTVVDHQAKGLVQDHAYVPFTPPTDKNFSVEATTFRSLNSPTGTQVTGIGFSDTFFGTPVPGIGSASSLSLTINPMGDIEMWDNAINIPRVAQGKDLTDVNLPIAEQGPIDMFLQLDPVNHRAIAEVNGIRVYDVPYTITEQITWAGMFNGGMETAKFDEFAVRVGDFPTNSTSFEWSHDQSGFWQTQSNWEPKGVPDANNAHVVFGDSNLIPRTVSVGTSDVTVKSIGFNSSKSYAISGLGTIVLESDGMGSAASINVNQGTHELQAPVQFNTNAEVSVLSGLTLEFDNRLDLNGHTVAINGVGTVMFNSKNILGNTSGAIQVNSGVVSGSGTVKGSVVNASNVSPGNSTGVLTVDGDYTQNASATLAIELSGSGGMAGVDYDRLLVSGSADLSGTLDLQMDASYTPNIGDAMPGIVTSANRSGVFATVNNVALGAREGLAVTYTATSVDVAIALRGNTDVASGDVDVDTGDLTASIINFTSAGGSGKTWADGDTDGDGDVDTGDLTTAIINFTSAMSRGATAVPEPGSLLLLILGMLAHVLPRRRSRV